MSLISHGQTDPHFERWIAIVALSVTLVATTVATVIGTASNSSRQALASGPVNRTKSCCSQDVDKIHLLAASYYSVKDGYRSHLMLNNKGPDPVEVRPTLYALSGNRLDVSPIVVPGESFQNVDLSQLGAVPGTLFEEGSLQLFHKGPDLVIGAQLYIVDEARSLSLDEKLVEFPGVPSTQLESVWWMPPQSDEELILSNTSDTAVTAEVRSIEEPTTLTLSAHETRKIRLNQAKGRGRSRNKYGAASVTHSGEKGALIARVLVTDNASGYSFSSQFYYPQGARSAGYQGVGLHLENMANQRVEPIAIARNVGTTPSTLNGRVTYTTTNGDTGVIQLPSQNVGPGEIALVAVDRFTRHVVEQKSIATAGLEFEYSTAPGSVIMVAQSVSRDRNQVFRVPLWDVPAQRNGTGGYPWFIDGASSTFVHIKNVTDQDQEFTFALTFAGGEYSTGVKKLKAKQSTVFDIRAMRDKQVPDEKGNVISAQATRGKIVWSVRGRDPLALLGRSEQVDIAKGISSSYACFMCCPNSFRMSWIEPVGLFIPVGNFTTARGVQRDQTCYGSMTPSYYYGDTWTVDNSSVLSVSGIGDSADVTAVGLGNGTVTAHWEVYSFTMEHADGIPFCVEESSTTEPESQTVVCTKPTGETTTFGGWSDSNSLPTVGKWNQTLLPTTTSFVGRTVTEQDPGGGGPDNCWFPGSVVPKFTSITGGSWTVGSSNVWGPDFVGFTPASVTYYRGQGRDPCSVTIPQRMVIDCSSGIVAYRTNTLGYVIDNPKVYTIRDGQQAERTWP